MPWPTEVSEHDRVRTVTIRRAPVRPGYRWSMATSGASAHSHDLDGTHGRLGRTDRPANPMGAYVATAGAVVFTAATFMDWVSTEGENSTTASGYEADTVVPMLAYLGLGFAVALVYAAKRARGRQHRGLSLSAMAAGLAAFGVALSYVLDVPGAFERGGDVSAEAGAFVGMIGAIIWSVGAGMLAKEPEGDDDWADERLGTAHTSH
jgi:hypothetical protein